jgi:hypothetical protein
MTGCIAKGSRVEGRNALGRITRGCILALVWRSGDARADEHGLVAHAVEALDVVEPGLAHQLAQPVPLERA